MRPRLSEAEDALTAAKTAATDSERDYQVQRAIAIALIALADR